MARRKGTYQAPRRRVLGEARTSLKYYIVVVSIIGFAPQDNKIDINKNKNKKFHLILLSQTLHFMKFHQVKFF